MVVKNTNIQFNDIDWHDVLIHDIKIDRSKPGIVDNILFLIQFQTKSNIHELVFDEVYWASFDLNFGIIADETIDVAFESRNDTLEIEQLRKKWKEVLKNIKLSYYYIKLNSTGSEIKIISKFFRLNEL